VCLGVGTSFPIRTSSGKPRQPSLSSHQCCYTQACLVRNGIPAFAEVDCGNEGQIYCKLLPCNAPSLNLSLGHYGLFKMANPTVDLVFSS
jgi:hypothetical protein